MKKILIAVAAFAVGASAFGAIVDWKFDAEDNGNFGGATFYAINGDASDYLNALDTAKVGANEYENGYAAFLSLINSATAGADGDYLTGSLDDAGYASGRFTDAADEMAVIVFDNGASADKQYAYVSGIDTTGFQYAGGQNKPGDLEIYAYTEQGDFDMSRGTVSPGPVPEPTSVALLALGLVALGLKRKVA